eukprot:TRINITY_DN5994_c0_g2_i3.p1 TRINITY_DN5994_c0_g2~~TRINITY_DN5994_c0_g2_i3.p1  ORF type:complete len:427 (-),score=48.53 TRINITY_DN5994_c0_g2_i3:241-1374(-)
MALRVPLPAGLRSASKTSRSEIKSAGGITVKASLKQQRKGKEFASHFGLEMEMAVLELERLFLGDPFLPQLSGPSNPSRGIGFSGRPTRVAYQGVRGSYCQEAAIKAFSAVCNAFPCDHMEDAFQALEDKTAERAIIPVENSIDGSIDRNLDLLLRHDGVEIVGELILPVNHCLLALPGTTRSDLKRIVSHPQAISHCKTNLKTLDLEIEEVSNSADAARYLSENQIPDTAVIGSKIAASEFRLKVVEQNFQDQVGNYNRFLQLGLETGISEGEKSRAGKTTVAFSLENGVSDLFRALWILESRNVTVTRVEHRPNRSNPIKVVEKETGNIGYMDYVFILDLEGSVADPGVENALVGLREISGGFVRVLGSYRPLIC